MAIIVPQVIQFGGGGFGGVRGIDETDLEAAYSLSWLRDGYTGGAIRVRRSSDNTEQDIGFSGQDLDETALLAFVGTGGTDNGFVVTWYDQSGNGYNATQATTSNQPRIINSGVLETVNSKAAIFFGKDSENMFLTSSAPSYSQPYSAFAVFRFANTPTTNQYIINADFRLYRKLSGVARYTIWSGSDLFGTNSIVDVDQHSWSAFFDSTDTAYIDGTQEASGDSGSNSSGTINLGHASATQVGMDGYCQEFLFYSADKSSQRTTIETNINNYYSIWT